MVACALVWPGASVLFAGTNDEELLFSEIPRVYTASRHEQPVTEAPAAVTVINRADIRQYGYQSLSEALASVPGFYVTDDRGYTYMGVRGVGVPTDYNNRVLFLLNGLPLNDKYYGQFVPELTPDMFDAIERLEVVKGPGSSLYGSDAMFAVVNIITRTGEQTGGATVSAQGGDEPSGRGVFSYGKLFKNGLDLFVSGYFEQNDGEETIDFGSYGDAHDADGQQLGNAYLSARYQNFTFQFQYAHRDKTIPTGQFGTILGDDRTETSDSRYLAELRWQRELTENKTLMMRAYAQSCPYEGTYAYNDPTYTLNREETEDRWLGYETQFGWQPVEWNQITVGAVFEHHWTKLSGNYRDQNGNLSSVYPGTKNDFSYWAIYLQDEWQLLPQLQLTAGGRFDNYPDTSTSRISLRAALVWAAAKRTSVKLLFGQAFRAPSDYERTYGVGSDLGPPSTDLDPEDITTYELVLEQDFQKGLLGRISVFYNDINGLITAISDSPDPLIFDNSHDVRTTGVEAELTKTFASGIRGFVNGTWQNSDVTGGTLANSPRWLANAGLVVPVWHDKLHLALRERYCSERPTRVPGEDAGDAFVTDMTLSSENLWPGWSFHLGVKNLFDERYTVPSGADGTVNEIPQEGRTIFIRASYHF